MVIKIILTTKALFNLFNQKVKKYIPFFFLSAQIINGKKWKSYVKQKSYVKKSTGVVWIFMYIFKSLPARFFAIGSKNKFLHLFYDIPTTNWPIFMIFETNTWNICVYTYINFQFHTFIIFGHIAKKPDFAYFS